MSARSAGPLRAGADFGQAAALPLSICDVRGWPHFHCHRPFRDAPLKEDQLSWVKISIDNNYLFEFGALHRRCYYPWEECQPQDYDTTEARHGYALHSPGSSVSSDVGSDWLTVGNFSGNGWWSTCHSVENSRGLFALFSDN